MLNSQALATIYKSFVRSQLEYCCPIWMGGGDVVLRRLDRIQTRAIRIMGYEGVKLWAIVVVLLL